MKERTVIITGGNSGLGFECARTIANSSQNWHIIIASRDEKKGKIACEEIKTENSLQKIDMIHLDLSSLQSIKQFVNNLKEKLLDKVFIGDTASLLRPGENYNPEEAFDIVLGNLLEKL